MKSILAFILSGTGVVSWKLKRIHKHYFIILMYHRIIPRNKVKEPIQAGLYVKPETFQRQVLFLKKYFSVVPISRLPYFSGDAFPALNKKPLCFLTFDDGWYDFYAYVFPILKAHRVPATVFLPTDFIGTDDWFWTDRLAHLYYQQKEPKEAEALRHEAQNPLTKTLVSLKGSVEFCIEAAIELLKKHPNEVIENVIKELSSLWEIAPQLQGRAFLSWEEVREMARSSLITFGSHTAGHRVLTTLDKVETEPEVVNSKEKLIAEKVVDPDFIPFSYPNGNYNGTIVWLTKDAGYSLAVTTECGWNTSASDPFLLRRIPIHQDMTSTIAMFGCRLLGIF